MDLFKTILPRNGDGPLMDPTKAHATLFRHRPASCNPNWLCGDFIPDPFYVNAISIFVIHDPGMLYCVYVLRKE